MVASVERIEQELAELDKVVAALTQELYSAYSDYLMALGQAVRQQVILAGYHVCTQGYPTEFLLLSLSQRQELQQALRNLANQTHERLQAILHPPSEEEPVLFQYLPPEPEPTWEEPSERWKAAAPEGQADPEFPRSLPPSTVVNWQEDLEQDILKELRTTSHSANRLLQQAGILPKKLPESFLQGASKSEMPELGGGLPNLLNVLIEAIDSKASEEDLENDLEPPAIMQIIAIHLRLSEIEFTNAATTALRNKIRNLGMRLGTLEQDYDRKEQEREIAQAQAAWRASWSED